MAAIAASIISGVIPSGALAGGYFSCLAAGLSAAPLAGAAFSAAGRVAAGGSFFSCASASGEHNKPVLTIQMAPPRVRETIARSFLICRKVLPVPVVHSMPELHAGM
jgi:hypothetical protein